MISVTLSIIGIIFIIALILTAALSPIESLNWWAGWNDEDLEPPFVSPPSRLASEPSQKFIVYLSGVSTMAGHYLADREARFLKTLQQKIPNAVIVSDIFPYSPSGSALLSGPRIFGKYWRRIMAMRLQGHSIMPILANIRNFFQILVSADNRYGPIYNLGTSRVIKDALIRKGYMIGSGAPVTIIGFSGGGQIGVGASLYLRPALNAPIDVISLGGVIASGPGIGAVRSLHRLYGSKDQLQKIGAILFPERWSIFVHSNWNQANRDGRIIPKKIGDMKHSGKQGYFGRQMSKNNKKYVDQTLEAVLDCVRNSSNHQRTLDF